MKDGAVACADCGTPLDEEANVPRAEKAPCPNCGSRRRAHHVSASVTTTLQVSTDALIVRPWDGASLTLFGVLYGIVVTVAGVVVAVVWPYWWAVGLYAGVALVLLAILLLSSASPSLNSCAG